MPTSQLPPRARTLPISMVPQLSPPTPTVENAQRGYTSSKPVRRLYRYRVAPVIKGKRERGLARKCIGKLYGTVRCAPLLDRTRMFSVAAAAAAAKSAEKVVLFPGR